MKDWILKLAQKKDSTTKVSYYDNYGFVLTFDELPEDLQQEKILGYIKYNEADYLRDPETGESLDLNDDELLERFEDDARRSIEAHFPLYF